MKGNEGRVKGWRRQEGREGMLGGKREGKQERREMKENEGREGTRQDKREGRSC